ncbi:MAG: lytic polysaccharide monooxygenase auxiliary activity family 9 protein [Actinocatenispora sp.]
MLTRRIGRIVALAATGVAAAGLSLLPSTPSFSHGYTTSPTSRAEFCAQGAVTGCGDIQYEPQSVEGPKGFPAQGPADGTICAGGNSRFAQLDDPRGGSWPVTHLTSGQQYQFTWHLTAQHSTTSFDYYVSNASYDPGSPLTRSTLDTQPFLSVPYGGQRPGADVTHTGTLPAGRSGRAMILAVWVIADTGNAFYQCSDVDFG